jgi:hypothetical protein
MANGLAKAMEVKAIMVELAIVTEYIFNDDGVDKQYPKSHVQSVLALVLRSGAASISCPVALQTYCSFQLIKHVSKGIVNA